MSAVIVLGSINVDLVIRGPRLPSRGETVLGGEFFQAAGGKGANQAVAAARAGVNPVIFIAAVGDDRFGQESLAGFASENIRTDYVRVVAGKATGVALILVDNSGENSISVASGANMSLSPTAVDAVPSAVFDKADVFLACLECPLETVACGFARAKSSGMTTILNPAPANLQIIDDGILANVDIITPNESEATQLTGINVDDEQSAIASGRRLIELGCRQVIITRGCSGVVIVDETTTVLPAFNVAAVDSTAAGDAFNGALAVAIAEQKDLFDSVRWASAAAAISVTRKGAQPSIPRRDEFEGLLND